MTNTLRIDGKRLSRRIEELGKIGALDGGGVCRLALTDEDKQGRDLVVSWMNELGLEIRIDQLGNVVGTRPGKNGIDKPVMTGSHIDTVRTGGNYDGNLGVLAGLEVIETLNDHDIETDKPVAVAFFTNEEGSRFAPDMMGSLVFQGDLPLQEALNTVGIDGTSVRENLERIGYAGIAPCGEFAVDSFVELHVEQGPVLDAEGIRIGAVENVQGISWMELTITGQSNHAGTTPMAMRHDAGYAAAAISMFVRQLTKELGGNQLATVGAMTLRPNLVNVVANQVVLTVDLRNTDEAKLQEAEAMLAAYIKQLVEEEGVEITSRKLARFEPVTFDKQVVDLVEETARELGFNNVKRMTSGAGHDAQIMARMCPAAMIFVPSVDGISHNIKEFTSPEDVEAGGNVLLQTMLKLAG